MDELEQFKKKLDELEDIVARLSFTLKEVKSFIRTPTEPSTKEKSPCTLTLL